MKIKEILEKTDFKGEFETKKRVFTMIDKELYVYNKGDMSNSLKKADLNEDIKSKISGKIF